ncbi:MFS general substrate transporter [Boletus edulis]|nr:MFS general substrate transporter [Boletus edulis]KAF8125936.1 MFS general substrate transporter [Boletus edulis]
MSTSLQQPGSARPYLRRIRLALLCFSVAANAICAGGVFCFPIISPALVTHLKLTQPQLTTIALVGMMGQYPFAAFVGKILDLYGAWACSFISACFFSAGFGLFANEISSSPDTIIQPSTSTFHRLVVFFFIAALGTVFSYFSSVFAASKNFPNYIGAAAGTSMALFGLSPTFLSLIASRYFSSPDGEVDVSHFLKFLAMLCGCVHLVGGFTMYAIPSTPKEESSSVILTNDLEAPNERTPMLPNKTNDNQVVVRVDVVSLRDQSPEPKQSTLDVLSDRNFWALAFIVFVVLGSCEMIISNIGTIVLSLPSPISTNSAFVNTSSIVSMTATQVRVLSISNTLSRLVVGPLADIVSPVPSRTIDGNRGTLREHHISRIAFMTFSTATLACTYAWMVIGVKEQVGIWALTIGAGIAYGCTFTILPSLVSSIWGLSNLGRNYGIMTYAPFLGTPSFSYLYAFSSDAGSASSQDEACRGTACWTFTFKVSALAATLACVTSVYLWRAWKGRV